MSAIIDEPAAVAADGPQEIINVLITMHPGVDALDFIGPLEILHTATHKIKDPQSKAFDITCVAATPGVDSTQGVAFKAHIDYATAHQDLAEYDVLIVPGGGSANVLKADAEPISLIRAFAELQTRDPSRERTLMSVCTGALFLAQAGVLQGFAATTHPDYILQLEKLCQTACAHVASERTDVLDDERYVVNNARFDLGDIDENPFVIDKTELVMSRKERRKSVARKGSNSWRESNRGRDANERRATLRLGGLRVITAGGVTAGMDAALYLVCALVSDDSAQEVARYLQYNWVKGVVVNAIDV